MSVTVAEEAAKAVVATVAVSEVVTVVVAVDTCAELYLSSMIMKDVGSSFSG